MAPCCTTLYSTLRHSVTPCCVALLVQRCLPHAAAILCSLRISGGPSRHVAQPCVASAAHSMQHPVSPSVHDFHLSTAADFGSTRVVVVTAIPLPACPYRRSSFVGTGQPYSLHVSVSRPVFGRTGFHPLCHVPLRVHVVCRPFLFRVLPSRILEPPTVFRRK